MKIYMAGVGGMLGQAFHHVFGETHELRCTDKDVNETWLDFLDFRNLDGLAVNIDCMSEVDLLWGLFGSGQAGVLKSGFSSNPHTGSRAALFTRRR